TPVPPYTGGYITEEIFAGFVGDRDAWLASLVGPAGPAGAPGATGPTGPTGATGPVSATGGAPVKAALPSVNVNWVNAETGAWFLGSPSYPGGGAVPTYGASLVRVAHPFTARIPVTSGEVITFSVGNPIYRASVTVLNAAHAQLYDSGWITTTPLTYTIPANGASLCILLSHADNSSLSPAEITKANLKLEFAAAKTAFSRHPSDVATHMARRPDVSGLLLPPKFRFIAHRGAYLMSPILPENSMAAFARAGANAAFWAIETDVQQTSDGRFVLMHDLTVDRTTNGTGTVTAMTYAAVRACILDASTEPVPNLTEYLLECKKGGKAAVIELKVVTNLTALVDEIIAAGMEEAAVIIDAGWTNLEAIRALSPRIHLMYLGSLEPKNTARAYALGRCGINAADQPVYLTAANILDAHRYGVFVIPQVINTGARTTELFNLGCDGITTDSITAVP
ncbi:MAG TPA: glycerophosphodiester phosphodiesterase family protein, partial [Tepidiformaceae bacterium]|nr:glycerophosphodiester phosphodiesterase family protein [Tepidiformaceae bacterium]